jgi:methionine aminopeptidase
VTADGLPSVHMEHTLALTRDGVYIVTADEEAPAAANAVS